MTEPPSGWRIGLQGLALVLVLNLLVFGVLWLRRSPPPTQLATPTPQPAVEGPELGPADPESTAAVAALRSSDPVVVSAARVRLAGRSEPWAAALVAGLAEGCHPELADRAELLAEDRLLTGAEAQAVAAALSSAGAASIDPDCAGRAARALVALHGSTSLDSGSATRFAQDWLQALPPQDLLAVPLVALIDRAAPEASGWPDALEALALDPRLHPHARAAACRGVVRRRAVPSALLDVRGSLPGPVQRCLLLPMAERRVDSARALLGAADVDVRLASLSTLYGFGEPEDVPPLLVRLRGDVGRRERALGIETAGYLVQLHMEQADVLVPRDAEPGSPAALVRARAEAGQPASRARVDALCDVLALPSLPLQAQLEAAQALGDGARLCLPPGSRWSGGLVVAGSEAVILALGPSRLDGALQLLEASVVVGLRAASVEASAGSVLMWAGEGGEGVLSVDGRVRVPAAAALAVQASLVGVEERGEPGGAVGWVRRGGLTPRAPASLHGRAPERAPRPEGGPPPVILAAPMPAPSAGGEPSDWVPAYGAGEAGMLLPLRAGDWTGEGPALLLYTRGD